MNHKLCFVLLIALTCFSCDNDGPYDDYLVARPVVMDAVAFKTEAIAVTDPVPIVSSGKNLCV